MIYLITTQNVEETNEIKLGTTYQLKEWLSNNKIRSIDTETHLDCWVGNIFTFQIGNSETQFVVDCTTIDLLVIKEELENPEAINILQNSKYDLKFFIPLGINLAYVWDTFLAECVLTTGFENRHLRLDYIVEKYCGDKYVIDKDIRGVISWEGLSERVIKYAAHDVIALEEVMNKQKEKLIELDLLSVADLEFKCAKIFAEMEYTGMKLDVEKWLEQARERVKESSKYQELLDNYILSNVKKYRKYINNQPNFLAELGFEDTSRKVLINWNSSSQVLEILNQEGFKFTSVNEKFLEKYRLKNELIKIYLDFKEHTTAVSKFGEAYLKWINHKTGAIHTSYWQILATGRISSGKKDEAPNMQQLPALNEVRNCFVSRPGYSYVDCDYSAMELVIAGCASKEDSWLQAFEKGLDLHSVVAEAVYKDTWRNATEENCEYAVSQQKCNCKKHKEMRNKIKTLNYLALYGGGPQKLSDAINIPLNEAKSIIKDYFKGLPKLTGFLNMLRTYGKQHNYIRTKPPFRRIRFFEPHNDDPALLAAIERQSTNTYVQGTGANITKYSMVLMDEARKKHNIDVKFVLQLHDAIVCEVKDEQADEWFAIQKQCMIDAFKEVIGYPIDVDGYIAKHWKK
jgi:DNA polymerase-1